MQPDTYRYHIFYFCKELLLRNACSMVNEAENVISLIYLFQVRLRVGMYYIFIKDWLDVFPREQILIIKTEDMTQSNIRNIYRQICQFLDISEFKFQYLHY